MNYYNEIETYPAQWLRNLAAKGHIPDGYVEEKSIEEVRGEELAGYTQCHFFAGIGGWSRALELAGWPKDREVWTGSCPCQPFSVAGKRKGTKDKRHLWPAWRRLIAECLPSTIFGEQVASPTGRAWLATVRSDLEALGYAVGAADLCAASVGAPHIRQRLWFCAFRLGDAHDDGGGRNTRGVFRAQAKGKKGREATGRELDGAQPTGSGGGRFATFRLDYPNQAGLEGYARNDGKEGRQGATRPIAEAGLRCGDWLADPNNAKRRANSSRRNVTYREDTQRKKGTGNVTKRGASDWRDVKWLPCTDGKARPTKPGIEPLAHGVSGRVGRLRAYGNAIVPQVAAEFILASIEAQESP